MAEFAAHKVVSSLPGILAANTCYFVRVGTGFRQYLTNSSGTIVAYPADPPDWSEITGKPGIATQAEVDAGTDTGKIVTPATLRANHLRRLRIRYGAVASGFSTDLFAEQENDAAALGFSWFNQGTSTFSPATGVLQVGGTSTTTVGLTMAMPVGSWDFALWSTMMSNTAVASGGGSGNNTPFGGLFFTDGTKLVVFGESSSSAVNATYPYRYLHYSYWNTATSFASQGGTAAVLPGDVRAYRLVNVSGTLGLYYSRDGVMWDGLTNLSLTAHIASPTAIGFCAGMTGNLACKMQVAAFRRFA